jgi:two-component system phosphate regulon response regulator PhoB
MNRTSKDIAYLTGASAPRVLIVEDEAALALLIGYNLEAEGYVVESVARGDEAELRLAESTPDLVILDWVLPGVSGIEICRRLRTRETTRTLPIIMVTARREEEERVRGLAIGADDYVVKPFSVPELMARVRALLRRSRPERIAERLHAGDLDLDRVTRLVRRGDRVIHLGPTDFCLLEYLLERPGRVFSRPAPRPGMGAVGGDRRAHGRCAHRPPAQEAVEGPRKGPDPHRAWRRLRLRRKLWQELRARDEP